MIRTLAFAGGAALFVSTAAPAFAQYGPHPAINQPPVAHAAPSDKFGGERAEHFVTAAAQSDEFERRAGHMAERLAVSPRVREFGSMMVQAHTKTTQDLQAAIRRTGHSVPPPPALTGAQQRMLEQLRTSGGNFDFVYLQQQVQAHQEALGLMQDFVREGP